MAKKGKKAKAAAAAAAASATAAAAASAVAQGSAFPEHNLNEEKADIKTVFESDLRLSHNLHLFDQATVNFERKLDENSTSFSLPNSPVVKATRSIQPSPTLSATTSQVIDDNLSRVPLPPLSIGEVLDPGSVLDFDWSSFDTQPKRGKAKLKPRQNRLRSPIREQVIAEEAVLETTLAEDIVLEQPINEQETHEDEPVEKGEISPFRLEEPQQEITDLPSTQPQVEPQVLPQIPLQSNHYPRGWTSYPMPYGFDSGGGSPYSSPYGHYPPYGFPHPRKLERHDSMASRGSNNGDHIMQSLPQMLADTSAVDDDPSDLLGRLHLAIPDLELLLRRYKETHGELGLREALVRKKEAEATESLKRKEEHIDRLMNQFHDAEKKHSREYNKLRLHIGNLEEIMKDLEDRLHASETQRKHEAAMNVELKEQASALVRERMLVAKAAAEDRDRLIAEYESTKNDTQKQLDAERIRLVELTGERNDSEKSWQATKSELESQAQAEKQELVAKANTAQEAATTAQAENDRLKSELANEKTANANGWEEKRAELIAELEAQKLELAKTHEEEISRLKKEHKDDLNEQTRAFVGLQESLNLKLTAGNADLVEEIANLKKAWEEDKTRFEKMIEELKGVAMGMEQEKGRLELIVQQFSDETDVKSKGDMQYIESFKQLSTCIFDLGSKYSASTYTAPLFEILEAVPEPLRLILGSSAQARSAYISHLISTILVNRVFTPFLFGLHGQSQETATLLTDVSEKLRAKSAHREAFWRQQTLLAAYTTAHAKLHMNKEAGKVVDEMVNAITPFCSVEEEGIQIRAAVRQVVKMAVETWRYVRLERERIEASMPEGQPPDEELAEDMWLPVESVTPRNMQDRGKAVLALFPVIHREPVQEGLCTNEHECRDRGCVYSKGFAFYMG